MQEYDFKISHIRGSDNIIADAMSRLCANSSTDTDENQQDVELNILLANMEVHNEEEDIPSALKESLKKIHSSTEGHAGVKTTLR